MQKIFLFNGRNIVIGFLLLLAVLAVISCDAPFNPEDDTPPTAGLEVFINGGRLEFETSMDYSAELGDEITIAAIGQDTDGLMCTELWSSSYIYSCRSSDGLSQDSQGSIVEPFCHAEEEPPDQVPTLLLDTREFVVDGSECNLGFHLTHIEACYFSFAQNYGSGSEAETTAQSEEFCYSYDGSE